MDESYNLKISEFNSSIEVKRYKKNIHRKTEEEKKEDRFRLEEEKRENFTHPYIEKQEQREFARSLDVSIRRTKQSIYNIARANEWEMFVTFTFNPKFVNRSEYTDVTKKLKKWLYEVKKNFAPDLIYILIPEFHKDKTNYHFHGLFQNLGNLVFLDSGKRTKGNQTIYNLEQYYLGFSNCTLVSDTKRVATYVTKYITKELITVTKNKKRYWVSQNIKRSKDTYINCCDEDFETILRSLGGVNYSKTLIVPEINIIDIMQIDY